MYEIISSKKAIMVFINVFTLFTLISNLSSVKLIFDLVLSVEFLAGIILAVLPIAFAQVYWLRTNLFLSKSLVESATRTITH